jgi:hypothetical protein
MCKNATRYNRTRNFGLYGHAESKKSKNLPPARHYDQIRFRFHAAKTRLGHGGGQCSVAVGLSAVQEQSQTPAIKRAGRAM